MNRRKFILLGLAGLSSASAMGALLTRSDSWPGVSIRRIPKVASKETIPGVGGSMVGVGESITHVDLGQGWMSTNMDSLDEIALAVSDVSMGTDRVLITTGLNRGCLINTPRVRKIYTLPHYIKRKLTRYTR